jgi:hypothetical protein
MDNKQLYLTHLQSTFKKYFTNKNNTTEQAEAKSYINGLMEAGRILGISFDELQEVLIKEQNGVAPKPLKIIMNKEDYLDIPTFIRNNM